VLDFGLGELLLLAAVALIVLGPEKLPHAARMAGAWYGRIRRTLANVQAEIANEVQMAEMRQRMNDELAKIKEGKDNFTDEMHEIGQSFENQIHPHLHAEARKSPEINEALDTSSAIMSQDTDWSHGIEAPLKSYRSGYYFFFVPHAMYSALIPSAPYLPKSNIVQYTRRIPNLIKHSITDTTTDPLESATALSTPLAHTTDLTSL
jgi:sec-independent protein translocase protein TatB